MTSVFALDERGANEQEQRAQTHPIDLNNVNPSFAHGIGYGLEYGAVRGGLSLARGINLLASAPIEAYETLTGQSGKYSDSFLRNYVAPLDSALERWTPSANDVGKAGQILQGLTESAAPLVLGPEMGPVSMIGSSQVNTAANLTKEGVSPTIANVVGMTQGAALAAGFKLPVLGSTLTKRVATGAAGNLALNTAATEAQRETLKQAGFIDQAQQFDPADVSARVIDVLAGSLYGGVHHVFAPTLIDAAMTVKNAKQFHEASPGEPKDIASQVAHQKAMETAVDQLAKGLPIDVGDAVANHPGEFKNLDSLRDSERLAKQVAREEPTDVPREHATATDAFMHRVESDHAALSKEYAAIPETEGGRILSVDTARELSPSYLEDRTTSAAVHEPASQFIKNLYAEKLREPPGPGQDNVVLLTAGGTGAGKSSGPALTGERAQIVYDTNMNRFESADLKVRQALDAGKDVHIMYVYRDPVEALTGGALPRAMRQKAELGSGRTVPLREHAATHEGSARTIRELAAKYADNPHVAITAIDNSRGPGKAKLSTLENLPQKDYTSLHEDLRAALEKELAAGRISQDIYQGFLGEEGRGDAQPQRGQNANQVAPREVSRASLADLAAPPKEPASIPEVAALERAAEDHPDTKIQTGVDADGNPVLSSVSDYLSQIDTDLKRELQDTAAYQAAVECFLSAA